MVIQKLQDVQILLKQDPPNVEAALRELDIAMQVAIQEWRNHNPPMPNWSEPIRPNDALLKEFGW